MSETNVSAAPQAKDEDAASFVVSLFQKQKKIYARAVSGWFAGWRWAFVWLTQLIFYGLPWLEWNGRDVYKRQGCWWASSSPPSSPGLN